MLPNKEKVSHRKRPGRKPKLHLVIHGPNGSERLKDWLASLPPGGTLQVVRNDKGQFQ